MTTEKRKIASRKNGKLGGVKTATGKAVSKMNAFKHGILSKAQTDYDPVNVQEIYQRLAEEFGVETPSRQILVEQLALTVLKLFRCSRAEVEIIKEGLNPPVVGQVAADGSGCRTVPMEDVVYREGDRATLSEEYLERLGLIYERYEPRLVNRMLRLMDALKPF